MPLLLIAISLLLVGATLPALAGRMGRTLCPYTAALGSILGAAAGIMALSTGRTQSLAVVWNLPLGSIRLEIDPLSAWFLVITGVVCAVAALYGRGYNQGHHDTPSASWPMFHLLIAAMLVVTTARNGVLFLLAWEAMSLTSFLLVMTDHGKESVRRAGWIYLVASHLGSAFLLVLFCMLDSDGTFDLHPVTGLHPAVFLLALVGFGMKAGLVPLHVWLPEAHPAAPSHVSAIMSGVMVKMGLYGLLRTLTLLGPPSAWWGWLLLGVGSVSAVLGVLNTLTQHDLKRVLAWSTVENMGVMTLALGLGVLGIGYGKPELALAGLAACLVHAANHSVFKALLFMGAGSVLHGTDTLQIDRMGGLLRRMPMTGAAMLIGFGALAALPPLSGFAGEFIILSAALSDIATHMSFVPGIPVVVVMALVGAMSLACAVRVFGIAFLGEPRTPDAANAHESNVTMTTTMIAMVAGCLVLGLLAPILFSLAIPACQSVFALPQELPFLEPIADSLAFAIGLGMGWVVLALAIGGLRSLLLRRRSVRRGLTWDCGYIAPAAGMQYTASSFSRPATQGLASLLGLSVVADLSTDLFPLKASLKTRIHDVFLRQGYEPVFRAVEWLAHRCRPLQQGRNQVYVIYIALTILILLVWKLRLS